MLTSALDKSTQLENFGSYDIELLPGPGLPIVPAPSFVMQRWMPWISIAKFQFIFQEFGSGISINLTNGQDDYYIKKSSI